MTPFMYMHVKHCTQPVCDLAMNIEIYSISCKALYNDVLSMNIEIYSISCKALYNNVLSLNLLSYCEYRDIQYIM